MNTVMMCTYAIKGINIHVLCWIFKPFS